MDLIVATIIFQNISLLRAIRLGPFSAVDLFITYAVAKYIADETYSRDVIAIFIILTSLGQGVHYALGIETPLIEWTIFAHRTLYNWLGWTPLC